MRIKRRGRRSETYEEEETKEDEEEDEIERAGIIKKRTMKG